MTTNWEILEAAHHALRSTVLAVAESEWDQATPCALWTVTQVFQHAAGDQLAFAAALTGGPGPSEDPFAPSGVLSDAPSTLLDKALSASFDAWAAVGADAENVPTPVPPGSMPAWLGAGACALDAAVHAWDIAVATNQPSPLTTDLARSLMPVATRIVEPLRAYGVYAAALEPAGPDDDVTALLCYLGRRPR
jgi:uncharacterized protein (TIGR03086 family)